MRRLPGCPRIVQGRSPHHRKLTLILTALTAVIWLSVWGAVTVSAADGAPQPNQPATASNPKSDDNDGSSEAKDDGPINPSDAEKAKAAALKIAGGGMGSGRREG
jgi:hypothetical protein